MEECGDDDSLHPDGQENCFPPITCTWRWYTDCMSSYLYIPQLMTLWMHWSEGYKKYIEKIEGYTVKIAGLCGYFG